jgi:hypothetical protein
MNHDLNVFANCLIPLRNSGSQISRRLTHTHDKEQHLDIYEDFKDHAIRDILTSIFSSHLYFACTNHNIDTKGDWMTCEIPQPPPNMVSDRLHPATRLAHRQNTPDVSQNSTTCDRANSSRPFLLFIPRSNILSIASRIYNTSILPFESCALL